MKLKALTLSHGAEIFKAFSEEPRIRIVNLIYSHEEMCVSDLEQILDYTQTKTSRHVSYLKNIGLLGLKKRDQWIYYYVKEEYSAVVSQLLDYVQKDSILQDDLNNYKIQYSNNALAIRKVHNQQSRYKLPEL